MPFLLEPRHGDEYGDHGMYLSLVSLLTVFHHTYKGLLNL